MTDKTRRELLEAAFDAEEADDVVTETEGEVETEELEETQATGVDDGAGEEGGEEEVDVSAEPAKEDKGAKKKPALDPQKQEAKAAEKGQQKDKAQQAAKPGQQPNQGQQLNQLPDASALQAPNSWKATEKAEWAKVPRSAQEAIHRREIETQRALSNSAGARRFADQFIQTINPFAHLIRAQNSTPLAAVKNLMTTASGLMTGGASQKAQIVAEIVANYGVDIKELDTALANQVNNPNIQRGRGAMDPSVAQALQPVHALLQRIEQGQQARTQELAQEAEETIDSFGADTAKHPHFEAVREDMADIMEIAAKRGQKMTLDQAYTRAVGMSPELSRVSQQRQRAAAAGQGNKSVEAARKRASTVAGAPVAGGGAKGKPASRREALEQAWDDNSR